MHVWQYLLLFSTVLLGGGVAQWATGRGREGDFRSYLPQLLSFSGAYLLGIAALEMMPAVFGHADVHTGLWLLLGFFIQLVLEGLSQGVEHGHIHVHRRHGAGYGIQVMIGLGLHALLEGLPLGAGDFGHQHGPDEVHAVGESAHLLYGIILHKLPAAFALALLLRGSGYSRRFTWGCLLVFAALSPTGALLGEFLSIAPDWRNRILALVIGSFLHISTTILFETDGVHTHSISARKFAIVVAGMGLAYLTAH